MGMMVAMVGMSVLGAIQGGKQAEQQVNQARTQQAWENHKNMMQTAAQNRKIARANAAQWMVNQEITEAAFQQAGEEKVYLRHRIDNEIGTFSRASKQQSDQIESALAAKNIKGGSAKAIFNSMRETQNNVLDDQAVSYGNMARDIDRRKDQALASRNFGYNDHIKHIATPDMMSAKAAGQGALMSGLIKSGQLALSLGVQKATADALTEHQATQANWMNAQMERWKG